MVTNYNANYQKNSNSQTYKQINANQKVPVITVKDGKFIISTNVGQVTMVCLLAFDYDFWLRLLLEEEVGLVDEKLVIKHGGHDDQLSTTIWGMDRFRVIALQKIFMKKLLKSTLKSSVQAQIIKYLSFYF